MKIKTRKKDKTTNFLELIQTKKMINLTNTIV